MWQKLVCLLTVIYPVQNVLGAGRCTLSPSRRSNRPRQGISWELQWKPLRNMTSACSVPTQANDDLLGLSNVLNTFVTGFSINDSPQLVGPVTKIFLNFPLRLPRSALMELEKLYMQILFLSRVRIAVLYHILLHSWILSCVSMPWRILSHVFWEQMRSTGVSASA